MTSAIAGRVGDRTVQLGQYVAPGARLMTIVPVSNVYLVANFKERPRSAGCGPASR
ncbi:MAG: HlyD family efflux transporter periplasmic adaptor subunit [Caulobacteraceae bacterium]